MPPPKDPVKREEYIQKLKDLATKNHKDPEFARKYKEGMEKRSKNPEYLQKMKDMGIRRKQDPVWREKHVEMIRNIIITPEHRQRCRENAQKIVLGSGI